SLPTDYSLIGTLQFNLGTLPSRFAHLTTIDEQSNVATAPSTSTIAEETSHTRTRMITRTSEPDPMLADYQCGRKYDKRDDWKVLIISPCNMPPKK
ncbi:hypothetical protein PMAYCL1PPCAC_09253, partial [Pristionchus mayeri]